MNLIHGGDWAGYVTEYGRMPLDFSMNISPLGIPDGVRQAAERAVRDGDRYPDPLCRALRNALSGHHGVPAEWILCGNGAADLIWRLMGAVKPRRILLTAPGFHEYAAAAASVGSEIIYHTLRSEQDFALDERILRDITPDTDLLILCQPCNPTGGVMDPELFQKILCRCRACGTLLAVDECFAEFLPEEKQYSLTPELKNGGLLIFRAFTKTYAMAGLRLGYCLSADGDLLGRMRNAGQPWPVSTVAQAAGLAAVKEREYCRSLRTLIETQRPLLERELADMGFRVISGQGNFILFYCRNLLLGQHLKDRGILIRDCSNFSGLGPGWYRIAVRTSEENRQLVAAMREVMQLWQNV